MAQFAPVCPVHILEGLVDDGAAGPYHLPLAHDVVEHPEAYKRVFERIREVDKSAHGAVILDNSVIELGSAVSGELIARAAQIVQPDVIVLPDAMMDIALTCQRCSKALEEWTPLIDSVMSRPWSYMFVPQGKSQKEFVQCAELFSRDYSDRSTDHIGWWGIGRYYGQHIGSRTEAVKLLRLINPTRKIHLLGFSDNVVDDFMAAQENGVNGIDSAVPIRAASLDLPMSLSIDQVLPPRGKWWYDPQTKYIPLMAENLNVTRKYLMGRV